MNARQIPQQFLPQSVPFMKNIKVAVMGCVVNGPGEARDADVGIAGGKGVGPAYGVPASVIPTWTG